MENEAKPPAKPVIAGLTPSLNPGTTYVGRPDEEKPIEVRIGELFKDAQAGKPGEEVYLYRLKLIPSEAAMLIAYCQRACDDNQPLCILPARGGVEKKE